MDVLWFLIAGGLLVVMALANSRLEHLPISPALLYLLTGLALSPIGFGLIRLDPVQDAKFLEVFAEIGILVSLFTTGLKLGAGLRDRRWNVPILLATVSMALTVGAIALVGVSLLGLSLGAAVLLGAILAPTDPVLAADVQVEHHEDRDSLRFGLTGEAGLNDGAGAPFVYLGLGLLGLHNMGALGWRWVAVDVCWGIGAGLAFGYGVGWVVSRLVLFLRRTHQEAVGRDEFLTLGLIALAYGGALIIHSYGFLAVFAAGLALRQVQLREESLVAHSATEDNGAGAESLALPTEGGEAAKLEWLQNRATDPHDAPSYLARKVLTFNEQLERLVQVALVLMIGGMLVATPPPPEAWWFVPLLLCVIRPLSVILGLMGVKGIMGSQRVLLAWFGIRGIGSVYYLAYAVGHGVAEPLVRTLSGIVLATVTASVLVHGISVTPLMQQYKERMRRKQMHTVGSETAGSGV